MTETGQISGNLISGNGGLFALGISIEIGMGNITNNVISGTRTGIQGDGATPPGYGTNTFVGNEFDAAVFSSAQGSMGNNISSAGKLF